MIMVQGVITATMRRGRITPMRRSQGRHTVEHRCKWVTMAFTWNSSRIQWMEICSPMCSMRTWKKK